jgi:GTP-binding protein
MDVANPEKLAKLRKYAKKRKLDLYEISAVTGKGIGELKYALGKRVAEIRSGKPKPVPRKRAASPRRARKAQAVRRIPKRAAFKKRKSR